METNRHFYIISRKDNVATALLDITPGLGYLCGATYNEINVNEKISRGYKIAIQDIAKDDYIIKYGYEIAIASENIKKGSCVHIHNTYSKEDQRSRGFDIVGRPSDREYKLF